MEKLFESVVKISKGNYKIKLLICFVEREERKLLNNFQKFNIKKTKFKLEYANVSKSKWKNYSLYSNFDLPGIKRI